MRVPGTSAKIMILCIYDMKRSTDVVLSSYQLACISIRANTALIDMQAS